MTLPRALFRARARFRPLRAAPLTVEPGARPRARTAARPTLDALGRAGLGGSLRIESDVPLRGGCGSSATGVLATVRAVADAFGATLEPARIAPIPVASGTASDPPTSAPDRAALLARRRGSVLPDPGDPLPPVRVLGFATEMDRGVETLSLPPVQHSAREVEAFGPMLGLLRRAAGRQHPQLLGRVATASTVVTRRHRPGRHMDRLLRLAREAGAVGVRVAHSGTVAGFLFEPGRGAAGRIERARAGLGRPGTHRSWEFPPVAPQSEDVP